MPCWEIFEAQDREYRESVLPPSISARVSIEAGVTRGWSRYVGDSGRAIGVDRYGASAPGEVIYEKLGITAAAVASAVKSFF
jgi:transketolase